MSFLPVTSYAVDPTGTPTYMDTYRIVRSYGHASGNYSPQADFGLPAWSAF